MAELDISGPVLAENIGVPYRSLDEFIRRKSGNYLLLQKIATALDTTMDALVNYDSNDVKPLPGGLNNYDRTQYDKCHQLIDAYKATIDEELSESYRAEIMKRFSEIAWQFQNAQPEKFLKSCETGEFGSFLDLYSAVYEIASDIKYFVMNSVIQNIRILDQAHRFDMSTYFTQRDLEEEAKRIIE